MKASPEFGLSKVVVALHIDYSYILVLLYIPSSYQYFLAPQLLLGPSIGDIRGMLLRWAMRSRVPGSVSVGVQ